MPPSPSVEPMLAVDQLFFRGERDAARRPTAVAVYVLDGMPDWTEVEYTFERASREFPRLRQRVIEPTAGVGPAHWVIDPDFDLAYHLRRARLPTAREPMEPMEPEVEAPEAESSSLGALIAFLEPELMSPLDLTRPLWEATLVEGLPGDAAALIVKSSHALADGLGGMQLNTLIFDEKRDAGRRAMPLRPLPEDLTPDELALQNLRRLGRSAPKGLRDLMESALDLGRRALNDPQEISEWVDSLRRTLGPSTRPSPLLCGRGLKRRATVFDVPLGAFKAGARAAGGSINDAYLAALTGALERYHERMGRPVDFVPMALPISTRKPGDEIGGNHFSGAVLSAPIGEKDVRKRVRAIQEAVRAAREEPALGFTDELARGLVALPAEVMDRLGAAIPVPDIQASNVPGPREPTYLAGARVEQMIGFGPVPGVAVMVVMLSYCDTCSVGLNFDPAAITDAPLFERCLHEAFDEILALAPPDSETADTEAGRK